MYIKTLNNNNRINNSLFSHPDSRSVLCLSRWMNWWSVALATVRVAHSNPIPPDLSQQQQHGLFSHAVTADSRTKLAKRAECSNSHGEASSFKSSPFDLVLTPKPPVQIQEWTSSPRASRLLTTTTIATKPDSLVLFL